jgi:regulator of sirC expression with transglutaminase-like and TPR domain
LKKTVEMINSPDALLQGAIAIAMHQMESVDPSAVDATLQSYADRVRSRVRGTQPQALLAHLHDVLFAEEGFAGNADDYYNAKNSYLPAVLSSKRGLPITLSLIYKIVAERLGLKVWGIGLPGHFMVAVDQGEGTEPMLVDPFAQGRILSVAEAKARTVEVLGHEVEWSGDLVAPASTRHWLTRMLQNLLHLFGNSEQYMDVAAVLEMEMVLWPTQGQLQRDLGLVLARIGLAGPASAWLSQYLDANPDDPQKSDLKQLLNVLTP